MHMIQEPITLSQNLCVNAYKQAQSDGTAAAKGALQSAGASGQCVAYDEAAMKKWLKPGSVDLLSALLAKLNALTEWTAEAIHLSVQAVVDENEVGFAKVAQPVRIAVTGSTMSPSIDQTLALLGEDETILRLTKALISFESALALR